MVKEVSNDCIRQLNNFPIIFFRQRHVFFGYHYNHTTGSWSPGRSTLVLLLWAVPNGAQKMYFRGVELFKSNAMFGPWRAQLSTALITDISVAPAGRPKHMHFSLTCHHPFLQEPKLSSAKSWIYYSLKMAEVQRIITSHRQMSLISI